MWNEVNRIMGACSGCEAQDAVREYQEAVKAYQDALGASTNDNHAAGFTRKRTLAQERLDAACAALLAVKQPGAGAGTGV